MVPTPARSLERCQPINMLRANGKIYGLANGKWLESHLTHPIIIANTVNLIKHFYEMMRQRRCALGSMQSRPHAHTNIAYMAYASHTASYLSMNAPSIYIYISNASDLVLLEIIDQF